jgi:hypothetical protein
VIVTINCRRRLEWKNFEVVVSGSKMINVRNVMNDAKEKLDFRDRVIKVSIGFKHMVVATSSQCYIYRFHINVICFNCVQIDAFLLQYRRLNERSAEVRNS